MSGNKIWRNVTEVNVTTHESNFTFQLCLEKYRRIFDVDEKIFTL